MRLVSLTVLVGFSLVVACEREFSQPRWVGGNGGGGADGGTSDRAGAGHSGRAGAGGFGPSADGGMGGEPAESAGGAGMSASGSGGKGLGGGDAGHDDGGAGNTGVNHPPTAVFDFYRFQRGVEGVATPGTAGAGGADEVEPSLSYSVRAASLSLRRNDTDPDDDPLKVVADTVTTDRGGRASLEADGTFTYTPPSDRFWGDDYFDYSVSDGRLSSSSKVRITLWQSGVRLDELDSEGSDGWLMTGGSYDEDFGYFAKSAGDVNGDGRDDLIVTARIAGSDPYEPVGTAYVVFGRTPSAPLTLEGLATSIDKSRGFAITDVRLAFALPYGPSDVPIPRIEGQPVSGAGDLDGDGYDDLVISSRRDENATAPSVYVVFGGEDALPVSLSDVNNDGSSPIGLRIDPIVDEERFGTSVAAAGDVNGDGYDDLVIGAPGATRTPSAEVGAAYVIFGRDGFGSRRVSLEDVIRGGRDIPGFLVSGSRADSRTGFSVASAGDVNGDGLDDLVIGAPDRPLLATNGFADGSAYVVLGSRERATVDVRWLERAEGTRALFAIQGANRGSFGYSVASAGYFDSDGLPDVLLGAPDYYPNGPPYSGAAYVAFGRTEPSSESIDGPTGYLLRGTEGGYWLGWAVASGDFNGDGRSDAAIAGNPYARRSYLAFGGEFPDTLLLSNACPGAAAPGENALCLDSGPENEHLTTTAGDFNGDGIDDVYVGSPESPSSHGAGYVVFGWDMHDRVEARHLVFSGGERDNVIPYEGGGILRFSGGHGRDTIRLKGPAFTWDLREVEPTRLESIEQIDLGDPVDYELVLDADHIRSLPSTRPGLPFSLAKTLEVLGDAGDSVRLPQSDFEELGTFEGRRVLRHVGSHYGLEVNAAVTIRDL